MQNKIKVINQDKKVMQPTYLRRAKQIVKAKRAFWVDETTICLYENETEEIFMKDNYISNGPSPFEMPKEEIKEATPILERIYLDEELYKIAKKKVQQRSGLIIHFVTYVAVSTFLAIIASMEGESWNAFVSGGWGIGLAIHTAVYFFAATPNNIHAEYLKQKNKYNK